MPKRNIKTKIDNGNNHWRRQNISFARLYNDAVQQLCMCLFTLVSLTGWMACLFYYIFTFFCIVAVECLHFSPVQAIWATFLFSFSFSFSSTPCLSRCFYLLIQIQFAMIWIGIALSKINSNEKKSWKHHNQHLKHSIWVMMLAVDCRQTNDFWILGEVVPIKTLSLSSTTFLSIIFSFFSRLSFTFSCSLISS